jgi:hypothetical protein
MLYFAFGVIYIRPLRWLYVEPTVLKNFDNPFFIIKGVLPSRKTACRHLDIDN